jgi:L-iditol 2-dehydrogenase
MNRVYPEAIRLAESGYADVRSVVTAAYPLTEHAAAFATAAAREGLKVVVNPSEPPTE